MSRLRFTGIYCDVIRSAMRSSTTRSAVVQERPRGRRRKPAAQGWNVELGR